MKRTLVTLVGVIGVFAITASQALAFDCVVANKPTGAGSAATVNIDTGDVTFNKPNPGTEEQTHGGFVTLTGTLPSGDTLEVDTFANAPMKSKAPFAEPGVIPGATKQEQKGNGCDGKGLDTLEACYFGG